MSRKRAPHNRWMNCEEGHLGGYIRASRERKMGRGDLTHGDPLTWTPGLWRWVVTDLEVTSVLDVGCGEGHAAGFFRELGCEVMGVDGSVQAHRDSVIHDVHVVHDFCAGPFYTNRMFDLVWSCEFVEHVEERFSENFLTTFCFARRFLFMTFAPPGQPGWHHVNCRPQAYWVRRVSALGFEFERAMTKSARQIAGRSHFGFTGLVFRRK